MKRIIFLTSFLLIGFNCLAKSGNELFQNCVLAEKILNGVELADYKEHYDSMKCMGYIAGYKDALTISNKIGVKTICLSEFTIGQLIMMVMNFARQNPEKLSAPQGILVYYALRKHSC